MIVLNKNIIHNRFQRSMTSYNREAIVQKKMAAELVSKITALSKAHYARVLEIGSGTGLLTSEFLKKFKPEELIVNDLVESMKYEISGIASKKKIMNWKFIPGDAEKLTFPGYFDLVISSSTFQWFRNIEDFFENINKSMLPGSILAFTTFGQKNLQEIKNIHNTGLQYPSVEQLNTYLSKEFEIIECTERIIKQRFATPMEVLRHIKQTGVNALGNNIRSKGELSNFENNYSSMYANPDNSVNLTYNPIIAIAKKK